MTFSPLEIMSCMESGGGITKTTFYSQIFVASFVADCNVCILIHVQEAYRTVPHATMQGGFVLDCFLLGYSKKKMIVSEAKGRKEGKEVI